MSSTSGCLRVLGFVDDFSCGFPLANRIIYFMPLPPSHQELATGLAIVSCIFVVFGFRKIPPGLLGCPVALLFFLLASGVTVFHLFIEAGSFAWLDWLLYISIFPLFTAAFASLFASPNFVMDSSI